MEFVDGRPLSQLIPNRGMKLTDALRIACKWRMHWVRRTGRELSIGM